jgi:hypothetical protein
MESLVIYGRKFTGKLATHGNTLIASALQM